MPRRASIAELRLSKVFAKEMEKEERKKKVRKNDVAELRLPMWLFWHSKRILMMADSGQRYRWVTKTKTQR